MAGTPWNTVCNYTNSKGELCGTRVRRGHEHCAKHGATEWDERATARRAYLEEDARVKAGKSVRAIQKVSRSIERTRSAEAANLMTRVLRGEIENA